MRIAAARAAIARSPADQGRAALLAAPPEHRAGFGPQRLPHNFYPALNADWLWPISIEAATRCPEAPGPRRNGNDAMGLSNSEKQRRYRQRHLGPGGGSERLSVFV